MESTTKNKKTQDFVPAEHLTQIKGKDYLEVKWRLVWFRQERPTWSLETEPVSIESQSALFKAYVKDDTGRTIATAHKFENVQGFGDFIEKAETGAIGRALALVGYGTQFAPELEEGQVRIVDSPVEQPKWNNFPQKPQSQPVDEDQEAEEQTKLIKKLYAIWYGKQLKPREESGKLMVKYHAMGLNGLSVEELKTEIGLLEP